MKGTRPPEQNVQASTPRPARMKAVRPPLAKRLRRQGRPKPKLQCRQGRQQSRRRVIVDQGFERPEPPDEATFTILVPDKAKCDSPVHLRSAKVPSSPFQSNFTVPLDNA